MSPKTDFTIGELAREGAIEFGDGYRTKRAEHASDGFRIVRVADIGDGSISLNGPDFVSRDRTHSIGPKSGRPGDILLTTKGTVGRVAIVPEGASSIVYSPQLCYFRVKQTEVIHPRFLSYWFKSDEFTNQASHRMNKTDMAAYINLADIQSLRISLPRVAQQRAIAEVLGALDDKIAANTKLAHTADDLAVASFRYAVTGAEYTGVTFADVAKVSGGGTPSTKVPEYWGGDVPWATPTDITALAGPYLESTSRTITEEGLGACSSELFAPGAILMTSRATIGAFAIAQVPTAVNQGFIVVEPHDEVLRYWMLHDMRSRVDEFIAMANGATFLELSRGNFKKFQVRVAEAEVMHSFGGRAAALHDSSRQALRENQTLAELRDTLLPELISGRLRVKDAEKQIEKVV